MIEKKLSLGAIVDNFKLLKKAFYILLSILVLWLLAAQSCMKFRVSDTKAIRDFAKDSVVLTVDRLIVDGRTLHYVKTGEEDRPTIVFLHGSPGAWDAFKKYLKDKDLLRYYRMVSVDRPGFGYSDYGDATDLPSQAKIIAVLLERLQNGQPLYIVGHSLGGPLCVLLAAEHQELIDGMVLLAASIDPNEEKPEKWRPIMKTTPLKYFLPGAFRPSNIELLEFKKDVLLMRGALQKIKCKVVIVHGMKDNMVPPANAVYAEDYLIHASDVSKVILSDANHFIPWTRYKEVKKVLLDL